MDDFDNADLDGDDEFDAIDMMILEDGEQKKTSPGGGGNAGCCVVLLFIWINYGCRVVNLFINNTVSHLSTFFFVPISKN